MGYYIKWTEEELRQTFDEAFDSKAFDNLLERGVLIEVKEPHGRLIDATEVITKIKDYESAVFISKAPTVIEAEVE